MAKTKSTKRSEPSRKELEELENFGPAFGMTKVFHYAPWSYLPRIVQTGSLRPSNAGAPSETPLLWFSANQHWEPTATKTWQSSSGGKQMMTFQQQHKAVGCVRFRLLSSDPRLLDWKSACLTAGTLRDDRRAMERAGKKKSADPAHWFAVADTVPLAELSFEVFLSDWMPADPTEMAQVWSEQRGT